MKDKPCDACNGTGTTLDSDKIGKQLSARRITAKLMQKDVAAKMGIVPQYLADLEKGRRTWTGTLIARFEYALVKLKQ